MRVRTCLCIVGLLAAAAAAYDLGPLGLSFVGKSANPGAYFWRPRHAVHFNMPGFVAVTVSEGPAKCTEDSSWTMPLGHTGERENKTLQECHTAVAFTGDSGDSWEIVRHLSRWYCGSLGVIRDTKLFCPGKRLVPVPEQLVRQYGTPTAEAASEASDDAAAADDAAADDDAASRTKTSKKSKKTKKAAKKKADVPRPLAHNPVVAFAEHQFEIFYTREDPAAEQKRREHELTEDETRRTKHGMIAERLTGNYVTYDQSVLESPIVSIRLGGGLLHVPERKIHIRNAEATLANGTALHVVYKSTDGGSHWTVLSFPPIPFGVHSSILRMSDTKVMLVSGEIGAMNQTTSFFLGNKWEKGEKTPFVMPTEYWMSRFFTTVTSGVVPRPQLGVVGIGTKKNSQVVVKLSEHHNNMTQVEGGVPADARVRNFSTEYLDARKFDCFAGSIKDSDGCGSSGFVSVVPADHNNTIMVIYDQLFSGFNAARHTGDHEVWAARFYVNETAEQAEYEAKVKAEEVTKETLKQDAENAKKAREEEAKKKKEAAAEKRRKNKERRQEWRDRDKAALEQATAREADDGQFIVIRRVDEAWRDLEEELF